MRIRFLVLGKFKNKALEELFNYYIKLATQFAKVESIALGVTSRTEQDETVSRWLEKNAHRSYVTVLDERGKEFDSHGFAKKMEQIRGGSHSDWTIICGGAWGFSDSLRSKAHLEWALAKMTLPHELALVVSAEQVFRGLSILANHPYHHQ